MSNAGTIPWGCYGTFGRSIDRIVGTVTASVFGPSIMNNSTAPLNTGCLDQLQINAMYESHLNYLEATQYAQELQGAAPLEAAGFSVFAWDHRNDGLSLDELWSKYAGQ